MKKKMTSIFFAHAPESHGLCPWMNGRLGFRCGVSPHETPHRARWCHGLCPRGSTSQPNTGIGLVEVLVVVAIIAVALVALAGVGNLASKTSQQLKKNLIATNLATELLEVVRAMKEENWTSISALSVGSPYHPVKVGSPLKWALAGDGENINGFSRQVVLNNVFRDSNDDIVASGGTLDIGTKKITAAVLWNDSGQNFQVILTSYLTNWKP